MTAIFQKFRASRYLSLKGKGCYILDNKWYLLAGLAICLSACNSSGKVNSTAAKTKTEAKVILPAQQVATPTGINYVYDYENIFTPGEEKKLDSLARIFEKSNLIPIRITTINNAAVTAENFDQRNKILLDEWSAIHGKSDRCMSVSISKQLRRIRIDYGPFVSRLLSDDEAKTIVEDQFKPSFKQDQFFQGSWNGLNALMNTIRKNIKF